MKIRLNICIPASHFANLMVENDLFSTDFYSSFGGNPANMFNPSTFCMYEPVPSQEPVIQWLSFVAGLHICFRSFFLYIN